MINNISIIIIIFLMIILINNCSHDNTDEYILIFLKAIYNDDNNLVKEHSNLEMNKIDWNNKITKTFRLYKDTGPYWTEYWLIFENDFALFLSISENTKIKINGKYKYYDWIITDIYPIDINKIKKDTIEEYYKQYNF
jgi:hypothetical protein